MKIAVAGIGYVGLANACLLSKENEVCLYDISPDRVEEQELRIISVLKTTDVAIKTDGYKLYKDYIPMYCKGERGKTYLRKVVLGPKIENANVVKEYYDHIYKKCGFDIDVSISTAPLR